MGSLLPAHEHSAECGAHAWAAVQLSHLHVQMIMWTQCSQIGTVSGGILPWQLMEQAMSLGWRETAQGGVTRCSMMQP